MVIRTDWRPGQVVAATLLTGLVPGAGHLLVRRWKAAAAWVGGFAAAAGLGWWLLDVDTLGALVDPYAIRRGLLISAFLGLLRVAAIIDVLWVTQSFTKATSTMFGGLVILAALLPHLYVQVQGERTANALETVFAPVTTTIPVAVPPVTAPTTPPTTTPAGSTPSSVVAGSALTSTTVASEPTLPVSRPLAPRDSIRFYEQRELLTLGEDGRFTVLLLGSDEGPGRGGVRTDSMIVASVDPWTLQTSLFSIPRNWAQVPMPEDWPGPSTHDSISNTIYRYGWTNAATLFPDAADPGAEALKRVLGDLLLLEIDQYWKVTMAGFVDVVDAFGGVEVNVRLPIDNEFSHPERPGEWYTVQLGTGRQHLDGLEALAYSRSRRTTSDYNRMGRQRCVVVAALGRQITPGDLLFAFDDLVSAFEDHISTDISLSIVPALVDVATLLEIDDISTVTFVPPEFVDGTDDQGRWVPHVQKVRLAVRESLRGDVDGFRLVETAEDAC